MHESMEISRMSICLLSDFVPTQGVCSTELHGQRVIMSTSSWVKIYDSAGMCVSTADVC